jgi:hypothetical protein
LNSRHCLPGKKSAADGKRSCDREKKCSLHNGLPYRPAEDVAGCIFEGLRMIFCARHAEISETKS